ncbi:hypothetical protein BANRA_05606 [Klebsiella pneumoniae]|nr:hypothetical protein BANRA_05606 [Klebsiella pneumoniae]
MAFRVAVIRSRRVFRISMNLPLRSFPLMREPEEVERFWFAFSLMARFSAAKRPNSIRRVFRVNRESELPQSALHGYTEAPGIVSFVEPDDDVIGVSDHYHIACGIATSPLMRPQIEDVVEVYVCQQR